MIEYTLTRMKGILRAVVTKENEQEAVGQEFLVKQPLDTGKPNIKAILLRVLEPDDPEHESYDFYLKHPKFEKRIKYEVQTEDEIMQVLSIYRKEPKYK